MEILNSSQRKKIDETDDSEFYSSPKFVYHLDLNFRTFLTQLYEKEIEKESTILDLMSSWDSYLPSQKNFKKVIGHGLNRKELERNASLDEYWIQNFNVNQKIPLENSSIDCCLMVAAWQYLQYPEKLTQEISRVLKPNGKILISFSNRAFWNKAPNIWTYSSEEERLSYVKKVITSNGFKNPTTIQKFKTKTPSFLPFLYKDPFYCIMALNDKNIQ